MQTSFVVSPSVEGVANMVPLPHVVPKFAGNKISCYIVQTRSMQRESFTPSPHHHNPHSPVIHACLVGTSLSDVEGLSGTQFRRSSVAEKAVYDGWGRLLSMLRIVTECPRQYSTENKEIQRYKSVINSHFPSCRMQHNTSVNGNKLNRL